MKQGVHGQTHRQTMDARKEAVPEHIFFEKKEIQDRKYRVTYDIMALEIYKIDTIRWGIDLSPPG